MKKMITFMLVSASLVFTTFMSLDSMITLERDAIVPDTNFHIAERDAIVPDVQEPLIAEREAIVPDSEKKTEV